MFLFSDVALRWYRIPGIITYALTWPASILRRFSLTSTTPTLVVNSQMLTHKVVITFWFYSFWDLVKPTHVVSRGGNLRSVVFLFLLVDSRVGLLGFLGVHPLGGMVLFWVSVWMWI